jgi:hypothetical protein
VRERGRELLPFGHFLLDFSALDFVAFLLPSPNVFEKTGPDLR